MQLLGARRGCPHSQSQSDTVGWVCSGGGTHIFPTATAAAGAVAFVTAGAARTVAVAAVKAKAARKSAIAAEAAFTLVAIPIQAATERQREHHISPSQRQDEEALAAASSKLAQAARSLAASSRSIRGGHAAWRPAVEESASRAYNGHLRQTRTWQKAEDRAGYNAVLVVVDNFCGFVALFPTKDKEAITAARCL